MINTQVGPFLIVKKLGTNRRQHVYHARQTEQDRDVALKFISIPPDVEWAKALTKIELEVRELQKLNHPNLVKVYGAGVHEERIFFATELIDGESLSAILSRRGKITPDLVVEYGRQIADVLRYLHHQELIHSKLTPEKILITNDHKVKIADLRLNRSKRRRWDSRRHRELDIAAYMAPEQFSEGATRKSDFYSLGVILFEMLAGKLPYEPDTMGRMTRMKMNAPVPSVATHVMNCPIWLDKIVTQMLQPNPRKRPHSARAIVLAFDEIKKIDATQKAAVDQMTSTFNALNAGADKTEARRLLGKKSPRPESADVSFFQSVPFMVFSLIAIIALVVFMALPPSTEKLIQQSQTMLESNDESKWSDARVKLKQIMDQGGPYAEQARQMYFDSRRKSLVFQAERGTSNRLQSENVRLFGKAVRLQQDGRDSEAVEIYDQLVNSIEAEGDEQHIFLESQERMEALQNQTFIPSDPAALDKLIDSTATAETPQELETAQATLSKVMLRYAGEEGYEAIVEKAKQILRNVQNRMAEQDESADDSGPASSPQN